MFTSRDFDHVCNCLDVNWKPSIDLTQTSLATVTNLVTRIDNEIITV